MKNPKPNTRAWEVLKEKQYGEGREVVAGAFKKLGVPIGRYDIWRNHEFATCACGSLLDAKGKMLSLAGGEVAVAYDASEEPYEITYMIGGDETDFEAAKNWVTKNINLLN